MRMMYVFSTIIKRREGKVRRKKKETNKQKVIAFYLHSPLNRETVVQNELNE